MKGAVAVDRSIGKSARSVASNAAAREAFHAESHALGNVEARACARTAAFLGSVVGSHGRGNANSLTSASCSGKDFTATENAIGEAISDPEDFIVSEAGIECDLRNEVRCWIERVSSCRVVAVAGAVFAQQVVVAVAVRGQRSLRILDGEGDRDLVAEGFRYAEAKLAGEDETRVIRGIDRLGTRVVGPSEIVVRRNTFPVLGHQTPTLACQERKSIVEFGLGPCLAEAERVAVGGGRRRSHTGRQEIGRHVAGKIHVLQSAVNERRNLRLASGTEKFGHRAL